MSKKIVVKLHLQDNKDKQKAMKAVSALTGIDEISVDMAAHKMTVIGMVDPVNVVSKLRKASWSATIDSVGPAKEPEPEKKEEKKDGEKKDGDGKKDGEEKKDGEAKKEGEGEGDKKKDGDDKDKDGDGKKPPTEQQMLAELMNQYRAYYPYPYPAHMAAPAPYYVQSIEENPSSCTIC